MKKCSGGAGINIASSLLPGGAIIHLAPTPPLQYHGGAGIYLAGWLGLSGGFVGQTVGRKVGWSVGRFYLLVVYSVRSQSHSTPTLTWDNRVPLLRDKRRYIGFSPKSPNTSQHVLLALYDTWDGPDAFNNLLWGVGNDLPIS